MMTMYEDLLNATPNRIFENVALCFQIIENEKIINYKKQTAL